MEFTEEVILGTLLGGTSQCNSSLESGGETLQDGMARSGLLVAREATRRDKELFRGKKVN
jgi:hypothetical protein